MKRLIVSPHQYLHSLEMSKRLNGVFTVKVSRFLAEHRAFEVVFMVQAAQSLENRL